MTLEELDKMLHEKHGDKYGILPPPTTDKEALEILIKHFLGDYYSVNPISAEQFNTEAIARIISLYPTEKKTLFDKLFRR